MHASTLSLATSIPTTTRLFCAIIHSLPCSVRAQKAHATVRVEEDTGLSHAPRQALKAFEHARAQIQRRAVGQNRPFAHSGKICRHKSTYKPSTHCAGKA